MELDAALAQSLGQLAIPSSAPSAASATEEAEPNASKSPKVVLSSSFTLMGTPGSDFSPFSGIGQRVFALPTPGSLIDSPVMTLRGPAVVVLVTKESAKREDFENQAEELMRDLRESKGEAALVESLARARRAVASKLEISNEYKNLKVRGRED